MRWVERRCRFVGEENRRFAGEGAGEVNAGALAARKFMRRTMCKRRGAGFGKRAVDRGRVTRVFDQRRTERETPERGDIACGRPQAISRACGR
ncbi:MAG: hypothetical protein R3C58_13895 [Parvularculaceae bacterium]